MSPNALEHIIKNSSLASAIRLHRTAAVAATPIARFMSTHVTNAACEDNEPGFLGSVETFYDRVRVSFLILMTDGCLNNCPT